MNTILEVLLGAILSILITIWIEVTRKPKLHIRISEPVDMQYSPQHPAQSARFLGVIVENKPLSKWVRWLSRNAALQCHAFITFYHLDGQKVFGKIMAGRWSGAPEPVPPIVISGERVTIESLTVSFDSTNINLLRRDIYPGDGEKLDIAARFDNDNDCYGWNNEAYFSTPQWRNPQWRLMPGRYLVKVEVVTAGEKSMALFRLSNDVPITSFRLEASQRTDNELILSHH